MIGKLHEAGLKSQSAYIADAARIGLSFLAWATSLKAEKAGTDRAERWGNFAGHGPPASSGLGNTLLHPLTATPGRAKPRISLFRAGSPDRRTGRSVTERIRMGAGMTAVERMAAVAMMADLLTGPAAPPNRPPARPRHRLYLWHVFMDWLGYRRARRGSAGGSE